MEEETTQRNNKDEAPRSAVSAASNEQERSLGRWESAGNLNKSSFSDVSDAETPMENIKSSTYVFASPSDKKTHGTLSVLSTSPSKIHGSLTVLSTSPSKIHGSLTVLSTSPSKTHFAVKTTHSLATYSGEGSSLASTTTGSTGRIFGPDVSGKVDLCFKESSNDEISIIKRIVNNNRRISSAKPVDNVGYGSFLRGMVHSTPHDVYIKGNRSNTLEAIYESNKNNNIDKPGETMTSPSADYRVGMAGNEGLWSQVSERGVGKSSIHSSHAGTSGAHLSTDFGATNSRSAPSNTFKSAVLRGGTEQKEASVCVQSTSQSQQSTSQSQQSTSQSQQSTSQSQQSTSQSQQSTSQSQPTASLTVGKPKHPGALECDTNYSTSAHKFIDSPTEVPNRVFPAYRPPTEPHLLAMTHASTFLMKGNNADHWSTQGASGTEKRASFLNLPPGGAGCTEAVSFSCCTETGNTTTLSQSKGFPLNSMQKHNDDSVKNYLMALEESKGSHGEPNSCGYNKDALRGTFTSLHHLARQSPSFAANHPKSAVTSLTSTVPLSSAHVELAAAHSLSFSSSDSICTSSVSAGKMGGAISAAVKKPRSRNVKQKPQQATPVTDGDDEDDNNDFIPVGMLQLSALNRPQGSCANIDMLSAENSLGGQYQLNLGPDMIDEKQVLLRESSVLSTKKQKVLQREGSVLSTKKQKVLQREGSVLSTEKPCPQEGNECVQEKLKQKIQQNKLKSAIEVSQKQDVHLERLAQGVQVHQHDVQQQHKSQEQHQLLLKLVQHAQKQQKQLQDQQQHCHQSQNLLNLAITGLAKPTSFSKNQGLIIHHHQPTEVQHVASTERTNLQAVVRCSPVGADISGDIPLKQEMLEPSTLQPAQINYKSQEIKAEFEKSQKNQRYSQQHHQETAVMHQDSLRQAQSSNIPKIAERLLQQSLNEQMLMMMSSEQLVCKTEPLTQPSALVSVSRSDQMLTQLSAQQVSVSRSDQMTSRPITPTAASSHHASPTVNQQHPEIARMLNSPVSPRQPASPRQSVSPRRIASPIQLSSSSAQFISPRQVGTPQLRLPACQRQSVNSLPTVGTEPSNSYLQADQMQAAISQQPSNSWQAAHTSTSSAQLASRGHPQPYTSQTPVELHTDQRLVEHTRIDLNQHVSVPYERPQFSNSRQQNDFGKTPQAALDGQRVAPDFSISLPTSDMQQLSSTKPVSLNQSVESFSPGQVIHHHPLERRNVHNNAHKSHSSLSAHLSYATAPSTPPTTPSTPTAPSTTPTAPSTTPTAPSTTPTAPSTTPTAPSTTPTAPSTTPTAPSTTPTAPSTTPTAPSTTPTAPSTTPTAPSTTPTAPSTIPTAPSTTPTVPPSKVAVPSIRSTTTVWHSYPSHVRSPEMSLQSAQPMTQPASVPRLDKHTQQLQHQQVHESAGEEPLLNTREVEHQNSFTDQTGIRNKSPVSSSADFHRQNQATGKHSFETQLYSSSGQYALPESSLADTKLYSSSGQYALPESSLADTKLYSSSGQYALPESSSSGQYALPDSSLSDTKLINSYVVSSAHDRNFQSIANLMEKESSLIQYLFSNNSPVQTERTQSTMNQTSLGVSQMYSPFSSLVENLPQCEDSSRIYPNVVCSYPEMRKNEGGLKVLSEIASERYQLAVAGKDDMSDLPAGYQGTTQNSAAEISGAMSQLSGSETSMKTTPPSNFDQRDVTFNKTNSQSARAYMPIKDEGSSLDTHTRLRKKETKSSSHSETPHREVRQRKPKKPFEQEDTPVKRSPKIQHQKNFNSQKEIFVTEVSSQNPSHKKGPGHKTAQARLKEEPEHEEKKQKFVRQTRSAADDSKTRSAADDSKIRSAADDSKIRSAAGDSKTRPAADDSKIRSAADDSKIRSAADDSIASNKCTDLVTDKTEEMKLDESRRVSRRLLVKIKERVGEERVGEERVGEERVGAQKSEGSTKSRRLSRHSPRAHYKGDASGSVDESISARSTSPGRQASISDDASSETPERVTTRSKNRNTDDKTSARRGRKIGTHKRKPGNFTVKIDTHKKKPGNFTEKIGTHKQKPGNFTEKIDTNKQKPGKFAEKIDTHKQKPGNFAEKIDTHKQKPGNFTEKIDTHKQKPGNFTEKIDTHKQKPGNFAEKIDTNKQKQGNFTEKIDTHKQKPGNFTEKKTLTITPSRGTQKTTMKKVTKMDTRKQSKSPGRGRRSNSPGTGRRSNSPGTGRLSNSPRTGRRSRSPVRSGNSALFSKRVAACQALAKLDSSKSGLGTKFKRPLSTELLEGLPLTQKRLKRLEAPKCLPKSHKPFVKIESIKEKASTESLKDEGSKVASIPKTGTNPVKMCGTKKQRHKKKRGRMKTSLSTPKEDVRSPKHAEDGDADITNSKLKEEVKTQGSEQASRWENAGNDMEMTVAKSEMAKTSCTEKRALCKETNKIKNDLQEKVEDSEYERHASEKSSVVVGGAQLESDLKSEEQKSVPISSVGQTKVSVQSLMPSPGSAATSPDDKSVGHTTLAGERPKMVMYKLVPVLEDSMSDLDECLVPITGYYVPGGSNDRILLPHNFMHGPATNKISSSSTRAWVSLPSEEELLHTLPTPLTCGGELLHTLPTPLTCGGEPGHSLSLEAVKTSSSQPLTRACPPQTTGPCTSEASTLPSTVESLPGLLCTVPSGKPSAWASHLPQTPPLSVGSPSSVVMPKKLWTPAPPQTSLSQDRSSPSWNATPSSSSPLLTSSSTWNSSSSTPLPPLTQQRHEQHPPWTPASQQAPQESSWSSTPSATAAAVESWSKEFFPGTVLANTLSHRLIEPVAQSQIQHASSPTQSGLQNMGYSMAAGTSQQSQMYGSSMDHAASSSILYSAGPSQDSEFADNRQDSVIQGFLRQVSSNPAGFSQELAGFNLGQHDLAFLEHRLRQSLSPNTLFSAVAAYDDTSGHGTAVSHDNSLEESINLVHTVNLDMEEGHLELAGLGNTSASAMNVSTSLDTSGPNRAHQKGLLTKVASSGAGATDVVKKRRVKKKKAVAAVGQSQADSKRPARERKSQYEIVMKNDVRRFQCLACGKNFGASTIYRHLRIHDPDYKVRCVACGKEYTQQHCLITHCWKVHGIKADSAGWGKSPKYEDLSSLEQESLTPNESSQGEVKSLSVPGRSLGAQTQSVNVLMECPDTQVTSPSATLTSQSAPLTSSGILMNSSGEPKHQQKTALTSDPLLASQDRCELSKQQVTHKQVEELRRFKAEKKLAAAQRKADGNAVGDGGLAQDGLHQITPKLEHYTDEDTRDHHSVGGVSRTESLTYTHTKFPSAAYGRRETSYPVPTGPAALVVDSSKTSAYLHEDYDNRVALRLQGSAGTAYQFNHPPVGLSTVPQFHADNIPKPISTPMIKGSLSSEAESLKETLSSEDGVHLKSGTGEDKHACEICKTQLKSKSGYILHMRRHSEVKTKFCSYCNKDFYTGQELRSHERTHTGEKPYKCEICHTSFAHSGSFVSHKKGHEKRGERDPFLVVDGSIQYPSTFKKPRLSGAGVDGSGQKPKRVKKNKQKKLTPESEDSEHLLLTQNLGCQQTSVIQRSNRDNSSTEHLDSPDKDFDKSMPSRWQNLTEPRLTAVDSLRSSLGQNLTEPRLTAADSLRSSLGSSNLSDHSLNSSSLGLVATAQDRMLQEQDSRGYAPSGDSYSSSAGNVASDYYSNPAGYSQGVQQQQAFLCPDVDTPSSPHDFYSGRDKYYPACSSVGSYSAGKAVCLPGDLPREKSQQYSGSQPYPDNSHGSGSYYSPQQQQSSSYHYTMSPQGENAEYQQDDYEDSLGQYKNDPSSSEIVKKLLQHYNVPASTFEEAVPLDFSHQMQDTPEYGRVGHGTLPSTPEYSRIGHGTLPGYNAVGAGHSTPPPPPYSSRITTPKHFYSSQPITSSYEPSMARQLQQPSRTQDEPVLSPHESQQHHLSQPPHLMQAGRFVSPHMQDQPQDMYTPKGKYSASQSYEATQFASPQLTMRSSPPHSQLTMRSSPPHSQQTYEAPSSLSQEYYSQPLPKFESLAREPIGSPSERK